MAGRPKKNPDDKKKQIALTLSPICLEKLERQCVNKPYSIQQYLNMYIEMNIDDILTYMK